MNRPLARTFQELVVWQKALDSGTRFGLLRRAGAFAQLEEVSKLLGSNCSSILSSDS
jgi:hypothetical protein